MRKALTAWLLLCLATPSASGQTCTTQPLPNALTEESAAALSAITSLENPVTEGAWLDLYVSSQAGGHYPIGDNGNSGEDSSAPLRNFVGLQARLNSMTDRCGVRVNLDWADDFTGADVIPLELSPTCASPDSLGIWVRSSLPGAQVQIDCTGWSGTRALFGFQDSGSGDGGWSAVENVHIAWCNEDLFSAISGTDSHGLILNSGGTVSGAHQILTAHAAGGGQSGNELVSINGYGSAQSGAVAIQPGSHGKITAVGRGTYESTGNSILGTNGTVNVVGHYFSDSPEPSGDLDRRLFKHSPQPTSSYRGFNLTLANVGARTDYDSRNGALYSFNSGCQAQSTWLSAQLFKTTISGWNNGYAALILGCPGSLAAIHNSSCVDMSDNERMIALGDNTGPSGFYLLMDNSIWDDDPAGIYSWKYGGNWYATREEFAAANPVGLIAPMSDAASVESGGPGVDGMSFESTAGANPSLWLPTSSINPDSVSILPDPQKEAYGSCETRFTSYLDPAIPAFVHGAKINVIDMNRCGQANIGYQ
jgi:hypothetical protein